MKSPETNNIKVLALSLTFSWTNSCDICIHRLYVVTSKLDLPAGIPMDMSRPFANFDAQEIGASRVKKEKQRIFIWKRLQIRIKMVR